MRRLLLCLLMTWFAMLGSAAFAHEMSMAEMQVRETTRGEFLWQWTASEKRAASDDLTPVWPEGCRGDTNVLHCGEAGLRGTLAIDGVGKRYSAALVKVFWLPAGDRDTRARCRPAPEGSRSPRHGPR